LALRLSGNVTQRNGYAQNQTTDTDVNDRDRWSVRADALWEPADSVSVRLIADYSDIAETCCGAVTLLNGPATQFIGTALGAVGDPADKFSRNVVTDRDPTNRLEGRGLSAQIDWNTSFAKAASITAYRHQQNRSDQDVDFTGANLANKDELSDTTSFTQEFRLASYEDQRLKWLVGAFYQSEALDSCRDTRYGSDIRAYADGLSGSVPAALLGVLPASLRTALAGQSNLYALELLQSLTNPSVAPGAAYFRPGQGIHDFYTLNQVSYSTFGQLDFDITDRFTISGGIAYLSDRKQATSDVALLDRFAALNLQNVPELAALGLPANLYAALNPLQFFYGDTLNHGPVNFPNASESNVLKGSQITYSARIAYDFGLLNAYASYSTGWKAGAYNLSSDSRPPDASGVGRTAAPEDVSMYEMGIKAKFASGYVNLALFDQSIQGFQSNAYTGTGYNLVNAGKQSVRGIELDGDYRPTGWLALTAGVTYLDPSYDSFKRAPCVSFDTARCPADPITGQIPNFRDLSGEHPARTPEWSAAVSATVSHTLGNGYGAYLRTEYDYASATPLTETVPANLATWSQSTVNMSLGLTNEPRRFEVRVWARNLTGNDTLTAAFPTVAQTGSYSGFTNQPRTYGLAIRKSF
jgi:iron complex outermembrane receptor protein